MNLNVKLIVLKSSLYRNSEISYLCSALSTENRRLWFKAWEHVSTSSKRGQNCDLSLETVRCQVQGVFNFLQLLKFGV